MNLVRSRARGHHRNGSHDLTELDIVVGRTDSKFLHRLYARNQRSAAADSLGVVNTVKEKIIQLSPLAVRREAELTRATSTGQALLIRPFNYTRLELRQS